MLGKLAMLLGISIMLHATDEDLCKAVKKGNMDSVLTALVAGSNANAIDTETNKSVLQLALDGGHNDIADLLISRGAVITRAQLDQRNPRPTSFNALDDEGGVPLSYSFTLLGISFFVISLLSSME